MDLAAAVRLGASGGVSRHGAALPSAPSAPALAANRRRENRIPEDSRRDGISDPLLGMVRLAVGGDREAFEALVRVFHADLRMYAVRVVGEEADDVLQEAYIKAFRAISRFRSEVGTIRSWLFTIVHRTALDHLRARTRRQAASLAIEGQATEGPEATTGLRMALDEALRGLTAEHRSVVILVDAIGLSYDEVAAILAVPRGTIASRLSHARRALYAALEAGGYVPE